MGLGVMVQGAGFRVQGLRWAPRRRWGPWGRQPGFKDVARRVRLRVSGLDSRVQGSGFWVQSAGFRVQDSRFRVQGSGFRIQTEGGAVEGVDVDGF